MATVAVKPAIVTTVRVLEGHDVTILHSCTINSIPGEDLEGSVVVV